MDECNDATVITIGPFIDKEGCMQQAKANTMFRCSVLRQTCSALLNLFVSRVKVLISVQTNATD